MPQTMLISLGVIPFGVALNAKCNNAKCNNLIVPSQCYAEDKCLAQRKKTEKKQIRTLGAVGDV